MKKLLLLFSVVLFLGCKSQPKLDEGIVIHKRYEPARTFIFHTPVQVGKSTILIPHIVYDNEDYVLTVTNSAPELKNVTNNIYVTKEFYDCYNEGDYWVRDQNHCYDEDFNNVKQKQ